MWCAYKDGFCLNPICLAGCVDQKTDQDANIRAIEALAKLVAAKKKQGQGDGK